METTAKRQHVQRGRARLETQRYYRRHRTRILNQSRKRYRRMRRNPAFKRKQKLYRQHPERFRRLRAAGSLSFPVWSSVFGDGRVVGVSGLGEVWICTPGGSFELPWEFFLSSAVFYREEDLESFFASLDNLFAVPEEVRAVSNVLSRLLGDRATDPG